jgi:hypothetical protein
MLLRYFVVIVEISGQKGGSGYPALIFSTENQELSLNATK